MIDVDNTFTAEAFESTRKIASNLQVSWKKESNLDAITFTIGVSTIGGNDVIGINPGALGHPGIYNYFDESDYLQSLAWEKGLNMPLGGLAMGLAEARLDNTSGRFDPHYIGGNSELFTAILPRRPFIINAGFNYDGIDNTIPQFSGVTTKTPYINKRDRSIRLEGADYVDFFQNRYLDQTIMFTGLRTDEVIEDLFTQLGMSTSQYDLDTGIQVIPFGLFEKGTRFSSIMNELAQAENAHLYQDEEGKFRFENRQHWDSYPYTIHQAVLSTGQVIDSEIPDDDHIINVVEVKSRPRVKFTSEYIFALQVPIELSPGENEVFVDYENPILEVTDETFTANDAIDGTGTNTTDNITIKTREDFAQSSKYVLLNSSSQTFLTEFAVTGRPAKVREEVYVRKIDDSSVTAYEERSTLIENDYILTEDWANSYAQMLLEDYSEPENLQRLRIKALPYLQNGDLVSWQGKSWRIYNIQTELSPSEGFIQTLSLLQREIIGYFRIGISTIGGEDKIAP